MTGSDEFLFLIKERNIITTAEVLAKGSSKADFYKYIKASQYEKIAHGVYAHKEEIKGKLGERVRDNEASARLSYWLGTITTAAPVETDLKDSARSAGIGLSVLRQKRTAMMLDTICSGAYALVTAEPLLARLARITNLSRMERLTIFLLI